MKKLWFPLFVFLAAMIVVGYTANPVIAQSPQVVTVPVQRQDFVLTVADPNYNPATWTYTLADLPKSGYQVDVYRCKDAFAGDGNYRGCTMMRSPWENWATAEFQIQGCCVFVPKMNQINPATGQPFLTSAHGDIFVFRYMVDRNFTVHQ